MSQHTIRMPPGTYGPRFIGSLLGAAEFFLFGWEGFFTRRQRRYGTSVFKVGLFQPTIAVLDQTGIAPLFDSPDFIQDYGFSWAKPPLALVGGVVPSVFGRGAAHDAPKAFFLDMVSSRIGDLPLVFERVAGEFLARWSAQGAFGWASALEDLAVSLVFEWLLDARLDTASVRRIYNGLFFHPVPWLERLVPGSPYRRSLADYARLIAFVQTAPRFPALAARARAFGISESALPHRLAFLLGMNGFLGVQSVLKSIVGELSRQPPLQKALHDALAGHAWQAVLAEPLLDGFMRELLRLHPPVALIFGRAVRARSLQTRKSGEFWINRGDLLMGVIALAQMDADLFPDPAVFDPHRYGAAAARAGLIWPRGPMDAPAAASGRTCPGKDPALLIAKMFCAVLASRYQWRLDRPPVWSHRYSLNVAAPKGALAVSDFRRRP